MKNIQTKTTAILVTLITLMAVTRTHHFGSALHLPDASWAIFLLAGFYLPRWVFPVLLVEVGLADYFAINHDGVSNWCFSSAYWFLIPTYFVLWFAGRFYMARYRFSLHSLAEFAGIAFVATGSAFLISNASFYLLADHFAGMSAVQYSVQVAPYFLPYLQTTFLYLSAATLLQFVAVQVSRRAVQAESLGTPPFLTRRAA